MLFSGTIARRAVAGAIGSGAVAAAMLLGAPAAVAQPAPPPPPPPNCTAADLAGVSGGVAMATSAYLFTHPDVNHFFTSLKGERTDEMEQNVRTYMSANPQVHAELQGIRAPLIEIKQRCNFVHHQ